VGVRKGREVEGRGVRRDVGGRERGWGGGGEGGRMGEGGAVRFVSIALSFEWTRILRGEGGSVKEMVWRSVLERSRGANSGRER